MEETKESLVSKRTLAVSQVLVEEDLKREASETGQVLVEEGEGGVTERHSPQHAVRVESHLNFRSALLVIDPYTVETVLVENQIVTLEDSRSVILNQNLNDTMKSLALIQLLKRWREKWNRSQESSIVFWGSSTVLR